MPDRIGSMSTDPASPAPADAPEQPPVEESPEQSAAPAPEPITPESPVVAKAGRYYRNARFFMVLLTLGLGVYFLYDGFIGYPKENAEFAAKPENQDAQGNLINKLPHSDLDLLIQKCLGFTLPPCAFAYLWFFMNRSRGAYRFDGKTLQIPGHPPFTLAQITDLDKRLWDRKGIAYLSYNVNGTKGKATLDDFIYDQKPTDRIYDAVLAHWKARG